MLLVYVYESYKQIWNFFSFLNNFLRCFSWKHIHLWIFCCMYFWKAPTKNTCKKCVYLCYICSEMGHDRLSYIFYKQTRKSKVLSRSVVSDSWDPADYSPPGSSVHGILQARILEWVAIPFSRESSRPSDQTQVSYIAGSFFTIWATREACKQTLYGTKEGLNSIAKILMALKWARNKNLEPL